MASRSTQVPSSTWSHFSAPNTSSGWHSLCCSTKYLRPCHGKKLIRTTVDVPNSVSSTRVASRREPAGSPEGPLHGARFAFLLHPQMTWSPKSTTQTGMKKSWSRHLSGWTSFWYDHRCLNSLWAPFHLNLLEVWVTSHSPCGG